MRRVAGGRIGAILIAGWMTVLGRGPPAQAQAPPPSSNLELSKQSDNPVTRLFTLPLRYEGDYDYGPTNATKSTLELDQAVAPFLLSDDWALITRTKAPYIWQPPKQSGQTWQQGLGNAYTTLFLSPAHGTGFYWGVGPVIYFPTATNSAVGVNKWGSGPSVAAAWLDGGPWVAAVVANNIWSFGGPPQSSDRTNSLLVNPIISYHFGDGWSAGTSPNITANWYDAPGKRWTVPVGGGVSKVVRIGGQPIKLSLDAYDDVVHPQGTGPSWTAQVTVTFLFAR